MAAVHPPRPPARAAAWKPVNNTVVWGALFEVRMQKRARAQLPRDHLVTQADKRRSAYCIPPRLSSSRSAGRGERGARGRSLRTPDNLDRPPRTDTWQHCTLVPPRLVSDLDKDERAADGQLCEHVHGLAVAVPPCRALPRVVGSAVRVLSA